VYQQREEPHTTDIVDLWRPELTQADETAIEFAPVAEDSYVVLDELISDQVRLAVCAWPNVDEGERLRFDESGSEPVGFERRGLQAELDRRREAEGQLPRPLRIGDVFVVQGFGEDPSAWERVLDVTAPARKAAGRAGLRAVAQLVEGPGALIVAEADAGAEAAPAPEWRRAPEQPAPPPAARPPAEPSPGSVSNAAV
jgi:hypothetical protein